LPHAHIANRLRKYLEIADQIGQRLARTHHDLEHSKRGQQAVAGGCFAIAKQDVAGLFSAESRAHALHFFEHILIADVGAQHLNAGSLQRQLQTHIRHRGRHHGGFREGAARLHFTRRQQQNRVAVDDSPLRVAKKRAVGIAIESDAHIETFAVILGGQSAPMFPDAARRNSR
jgi:hypothetical protein